MDKNRLERLIAGEISKVSINCEDTRRCTAAIMDHIDDCLGNNGVQKPAEVK